MMCSRAKQRKKWNVQNRDKYLAHRAVENAVRRGKLQKKPCQRCGALPSVGHHDDYRERLEVMWLCWPCHIARHIEIGRPMGGSQAGEKNGNSQLTMELVSDIRTKYASGEFSQRALAEMFAVCPASISNIVGNKSWRAD